MPRPRTTIGEPWRGAPRGSGFDLATMTTLARLLLLVTLALVCGCTTSPVSIESTHDEDVDWTELRTYSWLHHEGTERFDALIRDVVDDRLASHGYRLVEASGDFRVGVGGGLRGTQNTSTAIWGWDGPHQAQSGKLELAMLDGRSPRVIWSAVSKRRWRADLEGEELDALVRETLNELLDRFPPE